MLTITSTLPQIAATALQNTLAAVGGTPTPAQFLGYVVSITQFVNSAGALIGGDQLGISSVILTDSAGNRFEEFVGATTVLTVGATATSTNITNTVQPASTRGVNLYLGIVSISATCTIRINLQGQSPTSTNWVTIYTASIDGQATASAPSDWLVQVYPGAVAPAANAGPNLFVAGLPLSRTIRAVVSITATASQGGANINYTLSVGLTP